MGGWTKGVTGSWIQVRSIKVYPYHQSRNPSPLLAIGVVLSTKRLVLHSAPIASEIWWL